MSRTAPKLGRNTPLRKLRPGVFRAIGTMLDPDQKWEVLAEFIHGRNGQLKFDYQQIRVLHLAYQRPNGSPTRDMLDAWSMDNPTVDQLIEVLLEAELFSVADYLAIEVLGESPDYRPVVSPNTKGTVEFGNRRTMVGSPEPQSLQGAPPYFPYTSSTHEDNNPPNNSNIRQGRNTTNCDENVPKQSYPCTKGDYGDNMDNPTTPSTKSAPVKKVQSPTDDNRTGSEGFKYERITDVKRKLLAENIQDNETCQRKNKPSVAENEFEKNHLQQLAQCCAGWSPGDSPLHFHHDSLSLITGNFNRTRLTEGGNLIGRGGFGEVFYGKIGNIEVAVKKLSKENIQDHTMKQFYTEIGILSSFTYEHLLPLVGYSENGSLSLVYLYMPNGSLEDRLALQGGTQPLSIQKRISIAKGIARGINHLHTAGTREIIHRDIKSANVLLDSNWVAKIGDCGLGHFGPTDPETTHTLTNNVIGTSVYISPEYRNWEISVKLDAYAYGVVLLEILTGQLAFDLQRTERDLTIYMTECCGDIMDMVDLKGGEWVESTAKAIYNMSRRLLDYKNRRPKITDVLQEIEGWSET